MALDDTDFFTTGTGTFGSFSWEMPQELKDLIVRFEQQFPEEDRPMIKQEMALVMQKLRGMIEIYLNLITLAMLCPEGTEKMLRVMVEHLQVMTKKLEDIKSQYE